MREIKFRIWNKAEKRWNGEIVLGKTEYLVAIQNNTLSLSSLSNEIMQYTGLKDKKGNEIYESDIVRGDTHYYEVKFGLYNNSEFYEDYGWYLMLLDGDVEGIMDTFNSMSFLKKIGNIYQNPELLNNKQS